MKKNLKFDFSFVVPKATREEIWPLVADWRALARWVSSAFGAKFSLVEVRKAHFLLAGQFLRQRVRVLMKEECSQWEHLSYNHKRLSFLEGAKGYADLEWFVEPHAKGVMIRFVGQFHMESPADVRLVKRLVSKLSRENFLKNYFCAEEIKKRFKVDEFKPIPAHVEKHINYVRKMMNKSRFNHNLTETLIHYVLQAPAESLRHIRPLEFATKWDIGRRQVVELFLQATKSQLLRLRWYLLCPTCAQVVVGADRLDALPSGCRCHACGDYFGRDFSKNVEMAFMPNEKVRHLNVLRYSFVTPRHSPQMLSRMILPAGAKRVAMDRLEDNIYNYAILEKKGSYASQIENGEVDEMCYTSDRGFIMNERYLDGKVHQHNMTDEMLTYTILKTDWDKNILTASKGTTIQAFRELFPDEHLAPNDNLVIGKITIMFTDLKSSTEMYEDIGDAKAFAMVRDHFEFMTRDVRNNNGGVVKTIGDAVMAAFTSPADALRAAMAMQESAKLYNAQEEGRDLSLKIGIHTGNCIAVGLNGRLDYLGSMVNMAARLQGKSEGGDIVVSLDTLVDEDVASIISRLDKEDELSKFKGFEGHIPFIRLLPQNFLEEVLEEEFFEDSLSQIA